MRVLSDWLRLTAIALAIAGGPAQQPVDAQQAPPDLVTLFDLGQLVLDTNDDDEIRPPEYLRVWGQWASVLSQ